MGSSFVPRPDDWLPPRRRRSSLPNPFTQPRQKQQLRAKATEDIANKVGKHLELAPEDDVGDILPPNLNLLRAVSENEVKHDKIKLDKDLLPPKSPGFTRALSEGVLLTKDKESDFAWKIKAWGALRERVQAGDQTFTEKTLDRLLREHDVAVPSGPDVVNEQNVNLLTFGGVEAEHSKSRDGTIEVKVEREIKDDATCQICLEDTLGCATPCQLAGTAQCSGTFCLPCMKQYLHSRIEASRYSAPVIPCPSCRRRLPSPRWMPLADPKDLDVYLVSAAGLMTDRCQSCHTPHSYLVRDNLVARGKERVSLVDNLFGALLEDHRVALMKAWARYENGAIDANKLLTVLIQLSPFFGPKPHERIILPVDSNVPEAPPFQPLSPSSFSCSSCSSSSSSSSSSPSSKYRNVAEYAKPSNAIDPTNPLLPPPSLKGLFHMITEDKADRSGLLTSAPGYAGPTGCKILRLVFDIERRMALQLAFLRKFPFVSDQGCACKAATCFKCKRKGHHVGMTCTQMQQNELKCEVQYCPTCNIATIKTEGCNSIICVCGSYWEWDPKKGSASEQPRTEDYDPCWGGRTWCFLEGGRRKQVQYISVGEKVLTAQGTFRAVSRIWYQDLKSRFSRDVEVVNFRGMWITSHHPVLVGNDWRFPAELSASYPAWRMADAIGAMYNFELEGHNDTIALCGEDGRDRPIISCTIGKFLGDRFGYTVFTRRSTRCPEECDQCDAVHFPGIDFGRLSHAVRWRQYDPFVNREWTGRLDWGGDEGCELQFKKYLLANPNMTIEEVESEEQQRSRVTLSRILPSISNKLGLEEEGRIGVTIGKFFPLHKGHEALFAAALKECDHLVVLVGDRPGQEVRGQIVAKWVAQVCPRAEVICVVDDLPMDSTAWAQRTLLVLDGRKPSVALTGEAYGERWAQLMGCEHVSISRITPRPTDPAEDSCKFHFGPQEGLSVNATALRQDMAKAWDTLSGPAKAHFCYRVVVTGAESTGTTTLAQELAVHFQTPCVPEYATGREYWAQHGEDALWTSDDFTAIVNHHLTTEDTLAQEASRVLICDTDPLATHLWHRAYCGDYPEPALTSRGDRRYDLYLLTCPDFPFMQDGTRNEERRGLMHAWFDEFMATLGTPSPAVKLRSRAHQRTEPKQSPVIYLKGSRESRFMQAVEAIDALTRFPVIHLPADLAAENPEGSVFCR